MKTRKSCEMYVKKFLDNRQSVVVDRCNFDRAQRSTWIEIAQYYKIPIDCVVLTTTEEVKKIRVSYLMYTDMICRNVATVLLLEQTTQLALLVTKVYKY